MPPCGRFSARTRRVPSSIAATADLLSAPRIVPPALRTMPSSITGSSGPSGGTVSRCAQRKIGVPPLPFGSTRQYRFPIVDPTAAPASSSSTVSPRSRRYRVTASATSRSSPGGLGRAASSVKRSTTSDGIELASHLQDPARSARPRGPCPDAGEGRAAARSAEERDREQAGLHLRYPEVDRPHALVVDAHRAEPHTPGGMLDT